MWSRATLVIAVTPPCHALVASSRPPMPTSMTADLDARPGEPQEGGAGQRLEFGWRTNTLLDARCLLQDLANHLGEVVRRRLAGRRPRSVRGTRQVRLGRLADAVARLAQSGGDERLGAALAVRASDQHAAESPVPGCPARVTARVCGPGPGGSRTGRGRSAGQPPAGRRRSFRQRAGQLVLVEDALVEARRQADVRHVALLEVHATAQLAARDVDGPSASAP